jgi:hypothetical protein
MDTTLVIYGILCVTVTVAWRAFLDRRERLQALEAECRQHGHDWGEPFGSPMGMHCNCRRCNRQRHRLRDGSWSD